MKLMKRIVVSLMYGFKIATAYAALPKQSWTGTEVSPYAWIAGGVILFAICAIVAILILCLIILKQWQYFPTLKKHSRKNKGRSRKK